MLTDSTTTVDAFQHLYSGTHHPCVIRHELSTHTLPNSNLSTHALYFIPVIPRALPQKINPSLFCDAHALLATGKFQWYTNMVPFPHH